MEISEQNLETLIRTCLKAMDTMDRSVQLYDNGDHGTAMAFLGAESENIAENLYRLEQSSNAIEQTISNMEDQADFLTDEQLVEDIVKGDAEVDELF